MNGVLRIENLIIVRGAGDLATGVIQKLHRAGLKLLVLEAEKPTAIRRTVALCEAVYNGTAHVEDITGRKIESIGEIEDCQKAGEIPLIVDPAGRLIRELSPVAVIDAILAKKNLGTVRSMAPITIALGPGFNAGKDVDAVIETMRGHNLGRLILKGQAFTNSGIPGEIGGQSAKRVLHAPIAGRVHNLCNIGAVLEEGAPVLEVGNTVMYAPFRGLIRGLIHDGMQVQRGMKIGDIDPRYDVDIHTISDKARCLGGAVLEAYFYLNNRKIQNEQN